MLFSHPSYLKPVYFYIASIATNKAATSDQRDSEEKEALK